jgi:hypothetical protein
MHHINERSMVAPSACLFSYRCVTFSALRHGRFNESEVVIAGGFW